jgi:hypothetical protein
VEEIVRPVREGGFEMFIGMRNRKIYFLRFILPFVPLLGGERAFRKGLWLKIPQYYKERFRIETALNYYADRAKGGLGYKFFTGLTQVIKERKYGFLSGFQSRLAMFRDILMAAWLLRRENQAARKLN